jgi:hypothetical protein
MSLILSGTDGLSDVDGTAATPAIRGTDANTGIFFPAADTIGFAEGGAESARINSSGNFGIGTASPASRLNIATGAAAPCTFTLTSNNTGTGAGDRGRLDFYSADNSGVAYQLGYMDYDRADGTGTASYIAWASRVSGTVAERMRIDPGGGVRINNTSDATFSAQLNTQFTTGVQCGMYLKVTDTSASQSMMIFGNTNNDAVGSIATNGAATAFNTSSDYRLKQDITPMTGALAKVALLKPVNYKWKFDGSEGEGFIAHELAEVCPNAVTGEKDAVNSEGNPIHQGIDTSFLVATLTAAIQEQQALITALTARITALETQSADNPPQGETP